MSTWVWVGARFGGTVNQVGNIIYGGTRGTVDNLEVGVAVED